ncbi:hypothetical protein SCHPADRAFT_905209 [Schizopora paradoxa]|uniref:Glutathione S-transferase UstS-like C-terminal domain-containing protein n=1 Tax=Schizopora paradoxa TaxID=27342 RepID=A0A0H2RKZ0_9AGAM|nr:hypothetical protein SCHPADRAFT_905209 [Schizopora paradoxa]
MKELGAEATEELGDGSPKWTLPVIHDSTTGAIIADSFKIASYLDDTYPDKPTLFPFGGIRAPILLFHTYFMQTAIAPGRPIFVSQAFFVLNPASKDYFRRTREAAFKMKIEEFAPAGPKREGIWAAFKEGLDNIASMYASNGDGTLPYFYGETISYADLIVVSHLLSIRTVLGPETPEWKVLEGWHGGRWKKLLELTKKYHEVDA